MSRIELSIAEIIKIDAIGRIGAAITDIAVSQTEKEHKAGINKFSNELVKGIQTGAIGVETTGEFILRFHRVENVRREQSIKPKIQKFHR